MEEKLKCKIPMKIRKLLEDFGYDNHLSMSQIADEDIDEIKNHASQLAEPVLIASGHRYLIKGLREQSKKETSVPAALKVSRKRSTAGVGEGGASLTTSGTLLTRLSGLHFYFIFLQY